MREPNCTRIVPAKNLWEIAIEFLEQIDDKLMEFNLKYAFITYKLCKIEKVPNKDIKKLVFLSCFNDVGKLYARDNATTTEIETYLFLKYFSPLKGNASLILFETKKNKYNYTGDTSKLYLARSFTKYLLQYNSKELALNAVMVEKDKYAYQDLIALNKLVLKIDLFYELNSMHYKTIVYKYISKMIFSNRERNKFFTMLSSLFEMYSLQTLYHSKVTAIVAYKISKKMKLKNTRCKKIYVAALAHDLGKVKIPLKILEKPDKLTDREYSTMKKHVTYTKDLLRNKMDYDIIEIAYRHHERLDGSGYPNKYSKTDLTLDQQILQVSDVISALIAKRSYKDAWSIDKTIEVLDASVEKNQFSKEIVGCFKKNQSKILKAANKIIVQADKIYDRINKERLSLTSMINQE